MSPKSKPSAGVKPRKTRSSTAALPNIKLSKNAIEDRLLSDDEFDQEICKPINSGKNLTNNYNVTVVNDQSFRMLFKRMSDIKDPKFTLDKEEKLVIRKTRRSSGRSLPVKSYNEDDLSEPELQRPRRSKAGKRKSYFQPQLSDVEDEENIPSKANTNNKARSIKTKKNSKASDEALLCATPKKKPRNSEDAMPDTPMSKLSNKLSAQLQLETPKKVKKGEETSESKTLRSKNPKNYILNESYEEDNDDEDRDPDFKESDLKYESDSSSCSSVDEHISSEESEYEENRTRSYHYKNNRSKASKTPVSTPKSTRKSISTLTPSMHERLKKVAKPTTPLQQARLKLHVSVLPKSLPCREEQFNDIYTFLHGRLSDCSGGCIYISGVPGTGKTATVTEVIRCLKKAQDTNELPEFDFVDINGMKLSEPRQAYVQIWKQLSGESKTWEEAQKLLQNRFTKSSSRKKMTLLLVDELDLLCTKRQDVVYNILDWPSKLNANLVVITIANTMDLPERILMGRVTSRLGLTRLSFPTYTFKQLEEIVSSRLKGFNAFNSETIQLVARKVAAVSGDARRALDICRRATEIAENNDREVVTMVEIQQALTEMIASPKIQAIKNCSDMEKIFLKAVCSEVNRTGVEEVVFKKVYIQMETLLRIDGLEVLNISEVLDVCARLGSYRLLICEHSKRDIHQRLFLNVSTDDVYFAIQNA